MGKPTNIDIQLFRADPTKHEGRNGWLVCVFYTRVDGSEFRFTSKVPLVLTTALRSAATALLAEWDEVIE